MTLGGKTIWRREAFREVTASRGHSTQNCFSASLEYDAPTRESQSVFVRKMEVSDAVMYTADPRVYSLRAAQEVKEREGRDS